MENEERIEMVEKGFEYFKRRRDSLKKKGEKYSDGKLLKLVTDYM